MSAKSTAALTTQNASVITGQTTPESITPITAGGHLQDIIDSMYNSVTTALNRTQTFADATARAANVPDFIGQFGLQIDTKSVYVASGTVAGNWVLLSNTQIQSDTYGIAGGTDAYSLTLAPALAAYAAGNSFKVLFTNANSTASSININTLGAKGIKKNGNVDLILGDIKAGNIYFLTYDGTNFQLTGGVGATSQTEITAPASVTGGAKMMGLAGSITPTKTGSVLVIISGEYTSDTTANDTTLGLRTGTGLAPSNGDAPTGTYQQANTRVASSSTLRIPFTINKVISFTPDTTYWIDMSCGNNLNGVVQLFNVAISAIEQ